MSNDYLTKGLSESLLAAGILSLIFLLITARRCAYNLRQADERLVLTSLGLSAFSSLACVLYPLTNLAFLAHESGSWKEIFFSAEKGLPHELSLGILALRVTSVAVGLNATRGLIEVVRLDPLPASPEVAKRLFYYKEAEALETAELSVYRNRFAQTAINLVQSGFYELNILLLWCIKLSSDGSGPSSALLAWALFYIIDDWRIIFRFSLALKGRFLKEHLRQLSRTNWLITFAGVWCAWLWGHLPAVVVYLLCAHILRRLLLNVQYGENGNWQIPGALDWKFFDSKLDHATGERKW